MSVLIVDAGSTKTDWIVLENGMVTHRVTTRGFNPNYADPKALSEILKELPDDLPVMEAVHYYGSGCGTEANRAFVTRCLKSRFKKAEISVTHDLMAVCHAVLGHEKGVACILGTGANSCLYDGNDITERAVSLGYLLGDEGSGCYIGRKLVRAYFYDLMPLELKLSFHLAYNLELNEFIKRVYHEPEASRYLAEFTKFAGEHLAHPYIQKLIKDSFSDFIQAFVLRYTDCRTLPVSFVGSVAFAFQDLLRESLEAEGLTLGKVMRSPAEGLIQMYS
jgi:N-acetylglucosamine kinase-like BadF-type ATPase